MYGACKGQMLNDKTVAQICELWLWLAEIELIWKNTASIRSSELSLLLKQTKNSQRIN